MNDKKVSIFFSWQPDISSDLNLKIIRRSLEKASRKIKAKKSVIIEIDEATRNVAGSPNIRNEIFRKIDFCDIFIADVTIINSGYLSKLFDNRLTSNPNVLVELGYAASQLGWNRVVCILNDSFGNPEELPFDIRQHRVTRYTLKKAIDRHLCEKGLTDTLYLAIMKIIDDPKQISSGFLTRKLKHDIGLFEDFKSMFLSIPVLERIENMANINPIQDVDHDWIRKLCAYCKDEEVDFLDKKVKIAFDCLSVSIEDFKFKIGLRLEKRHSTPGDSTTGYYLRIPTEDDWWGSHDQYTKHYQSISDEIFNSGMFAKEKFIEFRRAVREELLV